jgi:hypothetical protein
MALDGQVDDPTALRAIVSALDRAGFSVASKVDVEVGVKPYQQVFTGIARGVGRDGKPAQTPTLSDPPALAPSTDAAVIDAEVVEVPRAGAERPREPRTPADANAAPRKPPPWDGEPMPDYTPKRPGNQLMTMEEANEALARERRRGRA